MLRCAHCGAIPFLFGKRRAGFPARSWQQWTAPVRFPYFGIAERLLGILFSLCLVNLVWLNSKTIQTHAEEKNKDSHAKPQGCEESKIP